MVGCTLVAFAIVFGLFVLAPKLSHFAGDHLGYERSPGTLWTVIQWPVVIVALLMVFAMLMRLGPNLDDPGFQVCSSVGVEFADGFRSIESVDDLLPERLSGTLDFTVCESVLLGQTLRARRAGGVILSNADLTSVDFRLALYRQTVTFMLRRRIPYAQAALTLRSHLKGTLCCH